MLLCERGDFQTVCIDSFRTLAFFAGRATYCLLPQCRRGGIGRRAGLKIQYWQQCVGSTPSVGRFSALDEILNELSAFDTDFQTEAVLKSVAGSLQRFLHTTTFAAFAKRHSPAQFHGARGLHARVELS